jgi:hypothetical protein
MINSSGGKNRMPSQSTETRTRTGTLSALALGGLLLLSGGIFAAAVLTKPSVVTNTANLNVTKHGLRHSEVREKIEADRARLDALTADSLEQQPATQPTDDCKPQMNQADFLALAALNRDVTCAGTVAPTVLLTQDIVLSPSQSFRIFLGGIDSDGTTTHSVNFDCQGHSITHSGYTFTMYYSSILRNCTIIRPTRGVWALVSSQVINTVVKNPSETAFVLNQNASITGSTALADTNQFTLVGNGFALLGDSRATDSQATSIAGQASFYWGFEVSDKAIATNITSTRSLYGMRIDDGAVVNNGKALYSSGDGFWLAPGPAQPGWFGFAATCNGCLAEGNGGNGFHAYGRRGSPSDQAISTINNGIAKGNAWNGFVLFDGSKAVNSKAENNGTNLVDIGDAFWPEDQAHFGFRLDYAENLQSVAPVINGNAAGNKNGALVGSTFSLEDGRYCSNAGQDIILKTGGTVSGNVTATKVQNLGGTWSGSRTVCGATGPAGKPPNITQ